MADKKGIGEQKDPIRSDPIRKDKKATMGRLNVRAVKIKDVAVLFCSGLCCSVLFCAVCLGRGGGAIDISNIETGRPASVTVTHGVCFSIFVCMYSKLTIKFHYLFSFLVLILFQQK